MNTNEIFEYICQATDEIGEELVNISRYMFENPEIGFKEVLAADRLSQFIESFGFSTCRGSGQLSTAVKGSKPRVNGINIGFLSETDALPIGHACGHNLIAASGVGAAIVFDKAIDKFQLNANSVWFATPAEEGGGGKAYMVKDGWFDAIDYAMMIHPCDRTMVGDYTLACQMLDIKYHGVSAHSTGSPWKGCNALAAMTQTISMIDAWRFQFKQTSRLTGYIVNGGKAVNVIPDLTELKYLARAETTEELMNVVDIVCRCAECAAKAFRCSVEIDRGVLYEPINNSKIIEKYMAQSFEMLGETVVDRSTTQAVGSTDMGNVSQKIPAIHGHMKLIEAPTHTEEFLKAAGSRAGDKYVLQAAKAMAMTAVYLTLNNDNGALQAD